MKLMKKFVALALAVMLVMGLATTAFAQTVGTDAEGKGSVTIENTTAEKEYKLYKLFDATVSEEGYIAYTGEVPESLADYFEEDSAGNIVAQKDSMTEAMIAALTEWTKTATVVASATSDGTKLTFQGLDYGYYVVTTTLGTAISVDSTNPDVTIIDKNQGPSWPDPETQTHGKVIVEEDGTEVTVNSANYGDTVSFKITVNATNYYKDQKIQRYYIYDTLADGLSFDQRSLKIFINDVELQAGGHGYMFSEDNKKVGLYVDWCQKDGTLNYEQSNSVIEVTYDAIVGRNAVIAGDGNLNTAWYDFKTLNDEDPVPPDPENPTNYHKSTEKTTTTYVYALAIQKVDADTKERLSGAEFTIKRGDTEIWAEYMKDGYYYYSPTHEGEGITNTFAAYSGGLVIKGLEAGTYTITETKAPAGYNVLQGPVDVTASLEKTSTYTTKYTTYYDADGNVVGEEVEGGKTVTNTYELNVVELIVENNAGTELPSTGGMGTTLFYILGAVLVLGAAILLVTKRRMAAED